MALRTAFMSRPGIDWPVLLEEGLPWRATSTILSTISGLSFRAAREARRSAMKRPVTIEPMTAMPNTPPTWRVVFTVADAMPARVAGTLLMAAVVMGLMTSPKPMPMIVRTNQ